MVTGSTTGVNGRPDRNIAEPPSEQTVRRLSEETVDVILTDAVDLEHLVTARCAAHHPHRAFRNAERRREDGDDRGVRFAAFGRSGHLHRQLTPSPARDLIATRLGGDVDRYAHGA